MDISDFDLMARLPQIMKTSLLDDMIKQQLEAEQIPSSQKYTECEFTEFGLSNLPRILPNTEGPKRRKTEKSNRSQTEGSGKQLTDKSKESDAELSVRTKHITIRSNPTPVSPSLQSEAKQTKREFTAGVSTGSDNSREENSTNAVAAEILVDPSIQSEEINDVAISGSVSTESQTHNTEKITPVQLLQSFAEISEMSVSEIFLFPSGDETLPQQETSQEDALAMDCTIQKLVEALTVVLPDVPRQGTEKWKKFRQEQLDARMQKDISKMSLDMTLKTTEDEAVKVFEITTVKIVRFAKKIPGYLEFSLDDQIKLIKDRCTDLQNGEQVRKVHAHLIACLRYVVTKEATDIRRRQEDLTNVLQTFRYMTTRFLENFKKRLIRVPAHAENQTLNEVL